MHYKDGRCCCLLTSQDSEMMSTFLSWTALKKQGMGNTDPAATIFLYQNGKTNLPTPRGDS
jgi:hypothetical protein